MNRQRIAAIALSNRDFPSFEAKLEEAARWVRFAAQQGAGLAVLPEALNLYRGDGPGNPRPLAIGKVALEDWKAGTRTLLHAAREAGIAVTVPVYVREPSGSLANVFHLVAANGEALGRYQKMYPTPSEIDGGVRPGGVQDPIPWQGLKVGGAICFDTLFPEVFASQAARGADLFLVPSLWPGGAELDHAAYVYAVPAVLGYPAWSRIIDMDGRELAAAGYRSETLRFGFGAPVAMADINFDRVALYGTENQERIVDVQREYGDRVRVTFEQQNCTFYLESLDAGLTVREVTARYGMTPRRDYLAACERRRDEALEGVGM